MSMKKPLLILDLDECLFHASGVELDRKSELRYKNLHIYLRPYLKEFLLTVSKYYRLAVWSMGTDKYVQTLSTAILPAELQWEFVRSRKHCRKRTDLFWGGTYYYKNLDILSKYGYSLEEITMIDNNPVMIISNHSKIVTIKSFWGDANDNELKKFTANAPNFVDYRGRDIHKRDGNFLPKFLNKTK